MTARFHQKMKMTEALNVGVYSRYDARCLIIIPTILQAIQFSTELIFWFKMLKKHCHWYEDISVEQRAVVCREPRRKNIYRRPLKICFMIPNYFSLNTDVFKQVQKKVSLMQIRKQQMPICLDQALLALETYVEHWNSPQLKIIKSTPTTCLEWSTPP